MRDTIMPKVQSDANSDVRRTEFLKLNMKLLSVNIKILFSCT